MPGALVSVPGVAAVRLIVSSCVRSERALLWSEACVWLTRKLVERRTPDAPKRLRRSAASAWEAALLWWGMLCQSLRRRTRQLPLQLTTPAFAAFGFEGNVADDLIGVL